MAKRSGTSADEVEEIKERLYQDYLREESERSRFLARFKKKVNETKKVSEREAELASELRIYHFKRLFVYSRATRKLLNKIYNDSVLLDHIAFYMDAFEAFNEFESTLEDMTCRDPADTLNIFDSADDLTMQDLRDSDY